MPTYRINAGPSRGQLATQELAQRLLLMGTQDFIGRAGEERSFERQKQLKAYEQELKPIEELPVEKLQQRYEKMSVDLETARTKSLMSGNVDQLKAIDKAEKDLQYLGEITRKKAVEQVESRMDKELRRRSQESLVSQREAQTSAMKAITPSKVEQANLGTALVRGRIKNLDANTQKLLSDLDKKGKEAKLTPAQKQFSQTLRSSGGSYELALQAAAPLAQTDGDKKFLEKYKENLFMEYKNRFARIAKEQGSAAAAAELDKMFNSYFSMVPQDTEEDVPSE